MLWSIIILLIIFWGWGFYTQIAGGMIHLLLVAVAAIGLMKILLSGRESIT